jgi:hypothetical protein
VFEIETAKMSEFSNGSENIEDMPGLQEILDSMETEVK